jgi:hypothetical protein
MTMVQQTVQWRFTRGDAGADEIQSIVDEILDELADPASEATNAARATGIEPARLRDIRIEVREGAQGAEPVLTTILIGFALKAGSTVADTLWREVIWPRLRRRLGTGVLGDRRDDMGRTR